MKKTRKITAKEIRMKLHKFENELHGYLGANSLTSQYRIKVSYMLMWMRLIPIKKKTLKGWSMPDMRTISDFAKVELNGKGGNQ